MIKTVLGIDGGFGHFKIIHGLSDGQIIKQFKVPSQIGITKKLEHVDDPRIFKYKDHYYYVGDDASHLPSENLISLTDYQSLEYYTPLFLAYIIEKIGVTPDIIVAGLSIAHIGNSGYFQAAIREFNVNDINYSFENVFIIPQGGGTKLCIDKYGHNFPVEQQEYLGESTYIIADVGMNTVDLVLVTDGKTSPNLFEGIENEGVMKIALLIAKSVDEKYNRQITLQEAREIIDTGTYKLRGKSYSFKEELDIIKKQYLKDLLALIESKYGKILDKCSFISVSGGGSTMFKSTEDGFIKIPKSHNEFYNSIGFFIYGVKQAK